MAGLRASEQNFKKMPVEGLTFKAHKLNPFISFY